MKLIAFEFKKLLGMRFLRVVPALFLAVNFALSFYAAQAAQESSIPKKEMDAFYALYFQNPEQMDNYYRELTKASAQDPMQPNEQDWAPQRYAPEGYSDLQMFTALYDSIAKAQEYPTQIDGVIAAAQKNISEFDAMGIPEDSYNYRLQRRIIDTYQELKSTVKIGVEPCYGWEQYFDFGAQNLFAFTLVLMVTVLVVSCDRTTDMMQIIQCTKKSIHGTVNAKIAVIAISAVGIVMAFSLTSYTAVWVSSGFSSAANAIQSVKGFVYCGYAISIGEYCVLTLVIRSLAFCLFGAFAAVVATLIQNRAIAFCVGVLTYCLHVLLNSIPYVNADHVCKNTNLIAVTDVSPLFARFRSPNLVGRVCSYVPLVILLYACLTALLFALFVRLYVSKRSKSNRVCKTDAVWSKIKERIYRIPAPQIRLNYLIKSELYKMLITSGMIMIILFVTAGKLIYIQNQYQNTYSISDSVYYDYMTRLEGPICDQSISAITQERAEIDGIILSANDMQQSFIDGKFTSAQYAKYLESLSLAQSKNEYLKVVENKRDYLYNLPQGGQVGWFVYDTGWLKLINSGADLFLIVVLSVVFCETFSMEYQKKGISDSASSLLRSTRHGKGKTFATKMFLVSVIALVLCIVYSLIDVAFVMNQFCLPAAHAPLISISQFETVDTGITIGQYLALLYAIRCAFAILLAWIAACLSCLLQRGMHVLSVLATVILLPPVLSEIGFLWADRISCLRFFAGTPLMITSFECNLFGSDYGYLLVVLFAVSLIAAVLWGLAYRKFAK